MADDRTTSLSTDKSVLRMAGPLMVSFTMRAAFTFVDTVYAAWIGDSAVAAIGLVVPFEFLMIAIWVGLSTGLTSALSRSIGSHENRKVDQYLRASWRLVWIVSPVFGFIGIGLAFGASRLDLEPAVARDLAVYGSTLLIGSAVTTFWSVVPDSVVKAHQDTRVTMWAGIWSNVINLVLNTVFLFGFGWGVFGIALSTVIGRIGGLAYALAKAASHERRRRAEATDVDCAPDPTPYRSILGLAIPASLTFALMATETALVNWILSRTPNPTEALASYSIYYRVVLFAFNPVIAISVAMLPFVARRFGRGDFAGIRAGLRSAVTAAVGYSVLIVGPVMLLGAPALAAALTESPVSERYTAFGLRLAPLACILGAPFLLCRPVFEGMRRGRPGLVMAAVRYLGLTAPAAWLGGVFALRAGAPAIYGIMVGLLAAAALSSVGFLGWLLAELRRSDAIAASKRAAATDVVEG